MNSEYGCNNSKLCGACLLRDNYLFSGIYGCTPHTYSKFQFAIAIITERASCSTVFCLLKDKPYLGYPVNNWLYTCTNALRLRLAALAGTDCRNWWRWPYTWHLDSARKSSLIRVTTPHGHIPARIPASIETMHNYTYMPRHNKCSSRGLIYWQATCIPKASC